MTLASSLEVPEIQVASRRVLHVSAEELRRHVVQLVMQVWRDGGRAYIGSTSDPAWRWHGGWYWPSGDDHNGQPPAHR
eukprot:8349621-Pyramimonas_sp.AAC.1